MLPRQSQVSISKALVVALFFSCTSALAGPVLLHANDAWGNLFTVDVATREASLVGNTGIVLTDIAFDGTGRLFGVTATELYQIDMLTATPTFVGLIEASRSVNALVFGADGTLWAADSSTLLQLDPTLGAGTAAMPLAGYASAGDLAFDAGGRLLLTTNAGALIHLDTAGNVVNTIGMLPAVNVYGFARGPDDVLYGLASDRTLLTIDPLTGEATPTGLITGDFALGSINGTSFTTEAYIPEPATVLLAGIAFAVLVGTRNRRRLLVR